MRYNTAAGLVALERVRSRPAWLPWSAYDCGPAWLPWSAYDRGWPGCPGARTIAAGLVKLMKRGPCSIADYLYIFYGTVCWSFFCYNA